MPHIVLNLILIAALVLTVFAYQRLVRYLHARDNGRLAPVLIARRMPLLLSMEQGGTTAWGTTITQNPFFNGNPMLDDVAQALGVRSAELIVGTDRKINEIAISCGYNDLPTFTRAFKRQFGMSPSEYRKK